MTRTVTADTRLTIGITMHAEANQPPSVWSSGAWQNIIFLYYLLKESQRVADVILVNSAHQPAQSLDIGGGISLPLVNMPDALPQLDVLLIMGIQIGPDACSVVSQNGGKVVAFNVGNSFVMTMENIVFDLKRSPGEYDGTQLDRMWTLPHHEHTCRGFFETCWRTEVDIVPYLWNPLFVEQIIAKNNIQFGYRPGAAKKRVAVFEPNLNMVKSCVYPMLICEEAYRQAPELLQSVHITNTKPLHSQVAFNNFAHSLDITKNGIASYDDRYDTPSFMAHYGDMVVSHQWENNLNNLYYDLLYGNYPLIHNSVMLKDAGYYYPEFDSRAGGKVLVDAMRHHDQNLADYKARSQAALDNVDIYSAKNIQAYEAALFDLFGLQ